MRFRLSIVLLLAFCLLTIPVLAQDEPAPEFLYRDGDHLVLVNGYTGDTTELPFEVSEKDRFSWSPDGQYLLAMLHHEDNNFIYCINLYDADAQTWLYDEPIACGVQRILFSFDGMQIIYTTTQDSNASLWLYDRSNNGSQLLYETTEGTVARDMNISGLEWSPTGAYLTFVSYKWIMGGTLNSFLVMDIESQAIFGVFPGDTYYASYDPIWSEDGQWFLITLKEQYVTSGALPYTNHQGDVYLVNATTGDEHRLTYTPAIYESDIRWTEDGDIAFTEVIYEDHVFTLEQAMNVDVVPSEDIVTPEPVEIEETISYHEQPDFLISPDTAIVARVVSSPEQNILYIGSRDSGTNEMKFSAPLPDKYQYANVLIGWRPSDFLYPQG